MAIPDIYEVRTDVTVGNETFPHVVARELQIVRAVAVADREASKYGLRYYVVKVNEDEVYETD